MNRFSAAIDKAQGKVNDVGARAMLSATNAAGRLMNTRVGKAMLVVPMAVLGPGIIGLGSLVAVVGGIQTGVGFKDDNADGKTRGFQTLIGGAIIAAVGALVPTSISLGG